MTVAQVSGFKGDERGIVALEFTVLALEEFLALLNASRMTKNGYRIAVAVEEFEPGKGVVVNTLADS